MTRLLIIDESLSHRLASELNKRGRAATSVKTLVLCGEPDPQLLTRLSTDHENWVLVTKDDKMPFEHPEIIAMTEATIATLDPKSDPKDKTDRWTRDIVHRWAHAMAEQEAGAVKRYGLKGHRKWTARYR